MRYILEPTSRQGQKLLDDFSKDERNFKFVDKYEPLEKISTEVEQIGAALRQFQRSGVSWDIFMYYLKGKGHSVQTIKAMMGDVKEFFKKLGILE